MVQLSKTPEQFMLVALEQAKQAELCGEVPVGAVVVLNNEIIAKGQNFCITKNDPTMHAEIHALRQAGTYLNNYRLQGCDLYVTLEPCMMCLGAMLHARIQRVYYGASDPKTGALGGRVNLNDLYTVNHTLEIYPNILSEACSQLLKKFFQARR